jgi:hypothetical protein
MVKSLREYVRAVARWWWIVTVGVIASIVGMIQSISGIAGAPVWVWVMLGFGGLSIAQFMAFHESRKELATAKEQVVSLQRREIQRQEYQPRIAIWFDENDPTCIQVTRMPNFTERRLRVGIQNVGGQTIEDTRVVMYLSDTPFNPTPMSYMHGPAGRTNQSLHPKEKRYIDAFATYEGIGAPTGEACIFYATQTAPNTIPRTSRTFTIEATGKDIESCAESFELVFPTEREPTIRPVLAPDKADPLPQ